MLCISLFQWPPWKMHPFVCLVFISSTRWDSKLLKGVDIVLLLLFQAPSLAVWNWDTESLVTYRWLMIMLEETWLNSHFSECSNFPTSLLKSPYILLMLGWILTCVFLKTSKILLRYVLIIVSLSFAYSFNRAIRQPGSRQGRKGRACLGLTFQAISQCCPTGFSSEWQESRTYLAY